MATSTVTTQPQNQPANRRDSQYSQDTSQHRRGTLTEGKRRCNCGEDDNWNYPWNKSMPKMCGLCCMWYWFCLVFPCSLCIPRYRDVICCVQEGCWDGTCCGSCICKIPAGGVRGMDGRVRHASDTS